MGTEKIKFTIELYSTMWDKAPIVEIRINNSIKIGKTKIVSTELNPQQFVIEHELEEGKKCDLVLDRMGKSQDQVVIDEKGDIIKDQLLHIKSIKIDGMDIGPLIYDGVYTPRYPEPWATKQKQKGKLQQSFTYATEMGHNGTWQFTFTPPFRPWQTDCNNYRDLQKTIDHYLFMQNDRPRNMWYLESLADCVQDKNCVEIGTGLGILSSIAVGLKPKSLTAYEKREDAYKIASQCSNKKINVVNAGVENLYKRPLSPTPDVIFHEIIGDRIWDEDCNLFLPYGIDKWQKPTWHVLPGEFITEIHVSKAFRHMQVPKENDKKKKKDDIGYKHQHCTTIDPGVSVDSEWLQKVQNAVYPMFDFGDDNIELVNSRQIKGLDSNIFRHSTIFAKFLVDVNRGLITKNDKEVISFKDIQWKEDTAVELNFGVQKDSFIFFRFGIKHKKSIFYLDQGHWGVCPKVLQVKKNTVVKIDQKLHNGDIFIEVEGKRHII